MAKPAVRKKASRLVGITLVDVSINFLQQDEQREPDVQFDYGVEIQEPTVAEDVILFPCSLTVRKRYKDSDEDAASIGAHYFCGIGGAMPSDAENLALAKKYAQTSIWSAFTSLFAICSQQMGVMFPSLPPEPGRVDISAPENSAEQV